MRHIWTRTAIVSAFLLCGYASMQAAPQDEEWYHNREMFYHSQDWKMHMFDRVRDDLNRVQTMDFHGNDEFRLNEAQASLTRLQSKVATHEYDEPQLDEVIATINRCVEDNRLSPRDREMLTDDLARLRDFRANHEEWWR
jgi:hypothetical protein